MMDAAKSGNVNLYMKAIEDQRHLFVKKHIYLTLRRAVNIVYKRLLILTYKAVDCSTRVHFSAYITAFKLIGLDKTTDEVQCYLTNLIYSGDVKGYLSRDHQILVLRKTDPFVIPEVS